jgi:hypothetical protein
VIVPSDGEGFAIGVAVATFFGMIVATGFIAVLAMRLLTEFMLGDGREDDDVGS